MSKFSIGMNVNEYCNSPFEIDPSMLKQKGKTILFSICRHIERKGLDILVRSLALLNGKNNDWHLFIGGEGPDTKRISKIIDENNLNDHITLLGKISEPILHGFFRDSDIFILPNRMLDSGDADGSPIVFIQASAYSLPCIGGDLPGTHDSIIDGQTGFVVDSYDVNNLSRKIQYLISNKTKRKEMGSNAYNYVIKNFKWGNRVEHFQFINEKLTGINTYN